MLFKKKLEIPKHMRVRLDAVAGRHDLARGFKGADDFGLHLVEVGLGQFGQEDTSSKLNARLDTVVDDRGYASRGELIEHLLERGLRAYEEPAESREKLEARLRGLGYIE